MRDREQKRVLHIVGTTDDPAPPVAPDPEITFDDFWTVYMRHVAKKDAMKAWSAIPKAQYMDVMIGAVAWRKVWVDRGEPEYVPYAATFLRGERWTDELPPGYTLMPRVSKTVAVVAQPEGERVPMPEHVRLLLAKLKGGSK